MSDQQHPPHQREALDDDQRARVADVFEQHRRFVENVARQHAPSPDDVPDIVQAVGMQVCRGLNGFRGESEIATWLFRVTVNTARDYYHKERRHFRAVEAVLAAAPDSDPIENPDETAIAGERLAALVHAVGQLRPMHRQAIHDRVRNQMGRPTVEQGEQVPEGTRKSRLFRARKRLKSILHEDPRFE